MLSGIANWVEDKATGYLRTGIQAGGTLAGNAVGGVGSLVENAGKSAASGVQGGIGGVGSYINGYGDSIKRSMSADGPTTNTPKKTAVKPSTPQPNQRAAPSTQTAKKALPSSQAPKKALPTNAPPSKPPPASAKKPPPMSKPAAPAQSAKGNATQKPPQTGKPAGPTSVKPKGPVGVSKPTSTSTTSNAPKLVSSVNSSGKVMVSPESRPGYKKTAVGGAANKGSSTSVKQTSDFLGIGENFGDINKTRPNSGQTNQNKNSSAPPRKPSASDPLALGEEIGNIGKKK